MLCVFSATGTELTQSKFAFCVSLIFLGCIVVTFTNRANKAYQLSCSFFSHEDIISESEAKLNILLGAGGGNRTHGLFITNEVLFL